MRRVPGQIEADPVARTDGELADSGVPLAVHVDRCAQDEALRSGDRADTSVSSADPRNDAAVVEPHPQLAAHRHRTAATLDQTYQTVNVPNGNQGIDDRHDTGIGGVHRLEDE